jgi:hypothetical protein
MQGFAAVVAAVLTLSSVAATQTAAQSASGDDYFVAAFGDPMDFSNNEDIVINTNEAMFVGGSNKSIANGLLQFDANGNFALDVVWPGFSTGIPHGREGGRVPIDGQRYNRLVFRMNTPAGSSLGLRWYTCLDQARCESGQPLPAVPGWHTYDVTLPWSGQMTGLRIIGLVNGRVEIDWVRLTNTSAGDVGEIQGGPTIDWIPRDKLDYATATGNPWDMDSARDAQLVGLRPGAVFANNRLSACTVGTSGGQFPGVVLNLNGATIDAGRFKTLTFEYTYEGAFSTRPVPGGGAFARVFWNDAQGRRHPTNSIHLYPNEGIVSVRLDDPRSTFTGIEAGKGATGAPWAGAVTAFRINPNDTKDSRCFTIGRVWLTADEPAGASVPNVAPAPTRAPVTTKQSKKRTTRRTTRTTVRR